LSCAWWGFAITCATWLSTAHAQEHPDLRIEEETATEYNLIWLSMPGYVYTVEVSDDLEEWSTLPELHYGFGQQISQPISVEGDNYFMRLRYEIATSEPPVYPDDYDGDGLTNQEEIDAGTDPFNDDSDGDTLKDGWEATHGLDPLSAEGENGKDGDPDTDNLTNQQEQLTGTDPKNADTDGDGMPDGYEADHGLDPNSDDAGGDLDGDGTSNGGEHAAGTAPNDPTSGGVLDPGDGGTGGDEPVEDPDGDPDGDGLTNAEEAEFGTDPNNPDTDGDGVPDGEDGWALEPGLSPPRLPHVEFFILDLQAMGLPAEAADVLTDSLRILRRSSMGDDGSFAGIWNLEDGFIEAPAELRGVESMSNGGQLVGVKEEPHPNTGEITPIAFTWQPGGELEALPEHTVHAPVSAERENSYYPVISPDGQTIASWLYMTAREGSHDEGRTDYTFQGCVSWRSGQPQNTHGGMELTEQPDGSVQANPEIVNTPSPREVNTHGWVAGPGVTLREGPRGTFDGELSKDVVLWNGSDYLSVNSSTGSTNSRFYGLSEGSRPYVFGEDDDGLSIWRVDESGAFVRAFTTSSETRLVEHRGSINLAPHGYGAINERCARLFHLNRFLQMRL